MSEPASMTMLALIANRNRLASEIARSRRSSNDFEHGQDFDAASREEARYDRIQVELDAVEDEIEAREALLHYENSL